MTIWHLAQDKTLDLTTHFHIMGIINCTPDSFSDGQKNLSFNQAELSIKNMLQQGASIIDMGGESTRPNASIVNETEEQKRLLPVFFKAQAKFDTLFSIDTYRTSTAFKALEAGAHIINDVWGLQKDPDLASLIAQYQAGIIIMHTNRERTCLKNVFDDQKYFFDKSLTIAHKAGIKDNQIVLDPGFGFGKNSNHSFELFKHASALKEFGYPLLAATSRKSFLGHIGLEDTPSERDVLTAVSSVLLRQMGFSLFRVHNVKANMQALTLYDKSAILA